jgi:hypothetical protein
MIDFSVLSTRVILRIHYELGQGSGVGSIRVNIIRWLNKNVTLQMLNEVKNWQGYNCGRVTVNEILDFIDKLNAKPEPQIKGDLRTNLGYLCDGIKRLEKAILAGNYEDRASYVAECAERRERLEKFLEIRQ